MSTILNSLPAGKYKRVAGTSGGEWAGPCPWCGGRDRFRVWPDHPSGATGGRYMCRGCGQKGDGIQFLRDSVGLSYQDACRALQIVPRPLHARRAIHRPIPWTPRPTVAPAEIWQHKASLFVAECAANMTPGSPCIVYAESRGLTADTVRALGIGWNPADRWEEREAWGLPPELNSKGNPKKVWLPAGLVIPSHRKVGLVAIKIRRNAWTPEDTIPKYVAAVGSVPGLALGCSTDKPVVIVESEIDAALIWQETGDLVGVIALATATGKPDADTAAYLSTVTRILVALDFDHAGINAFPWWPRHFTMAEPWPVVRGKDVGDMVGTPGLVRAWIKAALPARQEVEQTTKRLEEPTRCLDPEPAPVGKDACLRAIVSVFGPVLLEDNKGKFTIPYPPTTHPDESETA